MTTPTGMPIEDRLRAHFAERASTMQIPGPEHDMALARSRDGKGAGSGEGGREGRDDLDARRRRRHVRRRPLLAAAVVVAIALVTGVVLAGRDDPGHDVRTDPDPSLTTDVPPTTEATPPTTAAEPSSDPAMPPPSVGGAPGPAVATGPIVGHDGILGSWNGSTWVRWNTGDPAPAARDYQVVRLAGAPSTTTGQPEARGCGVEDRPTVDVGLSGDGATGVAVAGVADVLPRPVEILDPSAEVYRQAADQVAMSLGVGLRNPTVTQVVRADLDGDGTAEVLVMAEQLADPSSSLARPGDWAVAFVRYVVRGEVSTTLIESHVTTEADAPYLLRHSVAAVADLNGDGRMEVVLDQRYYEGSATTVYEYLGGGFKEVLTAGCGV